MLAPPLIFAGLAGLFLVGMLKGDPNSLPSVFIGQPAPPVPEAPLTGRIHLTDDMLRSGEVTVVNFWASWCPPCRAEHPYLLQLQADGVRVAGINFNDTSRSLPTAIWMAPRIRSSPSAMTLRAAPRSTGA